MGDRKDLGELLHHHGLKKTLIRTEILDLFVNHDFALTASEIIAKLKTANDRVTVYRALASFEKHGIIHKAVEDGQGVKYAYCGDSCTSEVHDDKHAHFICKECNKTFCLTNVEIPTVRIPQDFEISSVDYVIKGTCKECN